MGESWYCLVFGMELGPMSWEELLQRAARGDLRTDSQVRQGDRGPWSNAGDVRGLLPAGQAGSADAPLWYCEILGAELGPMSRGDLYELARRGNLRPDNPVRSQTDDDWSAGADIAGLFSNVAPASVAAKSPAAGAASGPIIACAASPAMLAPHLTDNARETEDAVNSSPEIVAADLPTTPTTEPIAVKPPTSMLPSAPAETPKAAKHARPNEKRAQQRAPRSEVRRRI